MASTNQTTNYGLPLYQVGDQALWTDTNTPFEEIDAALKTASDNASGAASSVSTLQTIVTALAQTVSGHTTQLSTLESSVATASTAQGTSFTAHGLNTATDVQTAIQNAGTSALNSYDNTTSGLSAATVQDAIDELNSYSTKSDIGDPVTIWNGTGTAPSSYVATSDGYVWAYLATNDTYMQFRLEGKMSTIFARGTDGFSRATPVFIRKGTTITNITSTDTSGDSILYFYPLA